MAKKRARMSSEEQSLWFGQSVIVTARWILVVAGFFLALWNPNPLPQLRVQILFILLLAVANFYLHAQLLMGKTTVAPLVYLASLGDLLVITLMVMVGRGFESNTFVFYFPAIAAFSVAFPRIVTFFYTASLGAAYFLVGLVTSDTTTSDMQVLLTRLIMLGAVAACGMIYYEIENKRRRAAIQARNELMAEVRRTSKSPAQSVGPFVAERGANNAGA